MISAEALISEFQTALNEEIECIKKQGGGFEVRARSGELEAKRGNYYFYVFLLDTVIDFPDDTQVEVRYGAKISRGFIVSIERLQLSLVLEHHIGDKVADASIAFKPYYLLEILRDRLKEVQVNYNLAKIVFGLKNGTIGEDDSFSTSRQLTQSQQKAIAKCLGSQVSFIWGPPGTGKTHTLAALVEILFARGKTLAILSHTNIAIDNAMEKIAGYLKNHLDYKKGKVLRFGQPHLKDLFERFPEIDLQHWVELRSKELFTERTKLEKELEKLEITILKLDSTSTRQMVEDVEKKVKLLRDLKQKLKTKKQDRDNLTASLKNSEEKLKKLRERLDKAKTMSPLLRFLTGNNLKKMKNLEEELSSEIEQFKVSIRNLNNKISLLSSNIKNITAEVEKSKKEFLGQTNLKDISLEKLEAEIVSKRKEIDQFKSRIQRIDNKIARLEDNLLQEACIIGTTLTKGFTKEGMFTRRFDVVIVDEASMAPLPALFFVSGLATERVVVIGDFRQLPPIAQAETQAVRKWLKTDVFEANGITRTVDEGEQDSRLSQLIEQYRMHPNISQLINKFVYGGRLKNIEKKGAEEKLESKVINSVPFSGNSLILCDTSSFDPWCSMNSTYSRFNPYEARLSIYLAKQAFDAGVERIGIITPYRAQVNLLTKMLWDEALEESPIDVLSVHRSQGREKDVIIFSLTEGRGAPIGRLNNGKFGSEAMKVINVAISRARSKLIIVGNFRHLLSKLNDQTTLKLMLNFVKRQYPTVNAAEILTHVVDSSHESVIEANTTTRYKQTHVFYPKAIFYKRFYDDLENHCRNDLVIFSPLVTRQRVEEMAVRFRRLVNKGVSILVFTLPLSRYQSFLSKRKYEALKLLKEIGVSVYERTKMNETFAVIDKSIYWYGNLNIFSQENQREMMARVVGQNAAKELLRLFKVDEIQRDEEFKKKASNIKYRFCPKCGSPMVVKRGPYGIFLSCSRYPDCKSTMEPDRYIIEQIYGKEYFICDKCGAEMEIKQAWKSRKGKRFLGCSRYPECKFTRPL